MKRLRTLEANRFDALLVAGDIGCGLESALAVMEILATFGCPVLYVLGNHDYGLPYDLRFADGCQHLHDRVIELGGHTFAGYSGVPANWGLNPFATAIRGDIERRHVVLLTMLTELEAAQLEALNRLQLLHAERISSQPGMRRSSRKPPRQTERARMEENRVREEARIRKPLQTALGSRPYATYRLDVEAADRIILERNRAQLSKLVAGRDPRSVVIATHDRQPDTGRDMPDVALFVFGHRHGYNNTMYKGSRFVNVSALDCIMTMKPAGSQGGPKFLQSLRGADLGSYTVMELNGDGEVVAMCRRLFMDPEGWEPCNILKMRLPMIAQGDPQR